MLMYLALAAGFLLSLLAIMNGDEDRLNPFLKILITFSILFGLVRINAELAAGGSFSSTPINVAVLVALASYVIYLFRRYDSRWN